VTNQLAGHVAARVLRDMGVPWVTGVPGESFLPLLDGLRQVELPYVPVVHESGATFLAAAYARMARAPAVVAVTRGPGASNALIGIHEAAQAGAPVVLIVGQIESGVRGRRPLQEMEFEQVFGSIAKRTFEVTSPGQIVPSITAAIRLATTLPQGPVVVSVPADHWYGSIPEEAGAVALPPGPSVPCLSDAAVEELVALLRHATKGLIVLGEEFANERHAGLVSELAERTGFGLLGGHAFTDAVASDTPFWIGASTIRGSRPLRRALQEADACLFLDHWPGDRVTQGYLALTQNLAVVSSAPRVGWDEYPQARLYVGDPVDGARRLLGRFRDGTPDSHDVAWVRGLRSDMDAEATDIRGRNAAEARGVPMDAVVRALDRALPDDVTVVVDAGSFNDWVVRYLPFGHGRHYIGTVSGSMGFAIPGAIGAHLARPSAPVAVLVGDGGFLMTGLHVATLVQMGIPSSVIVLRNDSWGSIALHQDREFPGHRYATDLPPVSYADVGRSLGASGFTVSTSDELEDVLAEAFSIAGPSVIEIPTDPDHLSPLVYETRAASGATSSSAQAQ
jgi:acetolactate synthase I/II/III large subunit